MLIPKPLFDLILENILQVDKIVTYIKKEHPMDQLIDMLKEIK